jgi:NAD+ kinase
MVEKAVKRVGVVANVRKPDAADALRRLSAKARERGMRLVACDETADGLPDADRAAPEAFASRIDLLIALGGDGTMLHAARMLDGADVPLLGVNLGSLGFLTSVTEDELERALEIVAAGRHTESYRTVALARLLRDGGSRGPYRALNDIVVGWGENSRVVTLDLTVSGAPVGTYVCDGLIVSTPTGSTGHSLSAGGPVIHPECPVFEVIPICPHTLSHRPMVVPHDVLIEIRVARSSKRQLLVIDGQEHQDVVEGDRIAIERAPRPVRFVHLPGHAYFSVLRQKLHWRGSSLP